MSKLVNRQYPNEIELPCAPTSENRKRGFKSSVVLVSRGVTTDEINKSDKADAKLKRKPKTQKVSANQKGVSLLKSNAAIEASSSKIATPKKAYKTAQKKALEATETQEGYSRLPKESSVKPKKSIEPKAMGKKRFADAPLEHTPIAKKLRKRK